MLKHAVRPDGGRQGLQPLPVHLPARLVGVRADLTDPDAVDLLQGSASLRHAQEGGQALA